MLSEEFTSFPDNQRLIRSFYLNADFLSLMLLLSFLPPHLFPQHQWLCPLTKAHHKRRRAKVINFSVKAKLLFFSKTFYTSWNVRNVRVHKQKQNQRSASLLIPHDLFNHLTLGEEAWALRGEQRRQQAWPRRQGKTVSKVAPTATWSISNRQVTEENIKK